ncbi:helix-turn-helix domain-containing protein [Paenibacillus sp. UASWS1643]|uniref:helix-turn-helix domain-containing protein n=1 Tax=Paenibacillus sp. UASWS1643 TaxID=2580422 RepID=UPI00123C0164|nr:helix-turn-helix transcriptional regulator [Paenibacillus sp. UASWS1643]KAA8753967.1 helix-turn-helix transcriptional regulator [Paenibacillus sp. UASWS1643]
MEGDVLLTLVGARIKTLRTQMGLSQVELAEKAKSQDTYIGEIERGNRNISLKMLAKVASALGVSVEDLFSFGEITETESMIKQKQLIEILRSKLESRSLEDVQLAQRILEDLFNTIDKHYSRK